jgi:triacylglycerol lipase
VTPYTSAFLAPGPNTTNVLLQDACPLDLSDHVLITHDPVAIDWVIEALDRPGPANPDFRPNCLLGGLVR